MTLFQRASGIKTVMALPDESRSTQLELRLPVSASGASYLVVANPTNAFVPVDIVAGADRHFLTQLVIEGKRAIAIALPPGVYVEVVAPTWVIAVLAVDTGKVDLTLL